MDTTERIKRYIASQRHAMVDLQKILTSVPAIAPEFEGNGEWDKAMALMKWLEEKGLHGTEMYAAPDKRVGKRPNMVLTLPGKSENECFWIMSHLDIVPPGERAHWVTDPYEAVEKNGRVYGRGTEDNQQGMVASIFALMALRELEIIPERTLKLLFVADEEVGSEYGIQYMLKQTSIFGAGDSFLVPDGGDPKGGQIEISEKSILWLKFTTRGKQTHASRPESGINAFLAGSDLVVNLNSLHEIFGQTDALFDPAASTFSPTKKEANIPNVNTIPGEDVFYLDSRILPSIPITEVIAEIDRICGRISEKYDVEIEYETVQRLESSGTPGDCELAQRLSRLLPRVFGIETELIGVGGGTVAAYLRNAGYDTVVWSTIDETAHMPNEYCVIENMMMNAVIMALLAASSQS